LATAVYIKSEETFIRRRLWHTPPSVYSTTNRQQAPEWSVLGQVNAFSP